MTSLDNICGYIFAYVHLIQYHNNFPPAKKDFPGGKFSLYFFTYLTPEQKASIPTEDEDAKWAWLWTHKSSSFVELTQYVCRIPLYITHSHFTAVTGELRVTLTLLDITLEIQNHVVLVCAIYTSLCVTCLL